MVNFNLFEYVSNFNDVNRIFIEQACGIDITIAARKDSFAKLTEHFLSLKNSRCPAPLSLYQNVVIYSYAQSKTLFTVVYLNALRLP